MPTVLRKNGFDFKINTEDHEPMHVHVWYQGRQVLINLEAEVSIRRNYGLNRNELRQALIIVEEYQSFLQTKSREIYGQ